MPHDRAQLGLHGAAGGMGDLRHRTRGRNVVGQGQPGSVDHDGLVTQGDRLPDDSEIVDQRMVLVDDGNVIEVQANVLRVLPPGELLRDRGQALALELHPFEPRHFDEGEGAGVGDGLADRFHHGQVGDVEGGHADAQAACILHDVGDSGHVSVLRSFAVC